MKNAKVAEIIEKFSKDVELACAKKPKLSKYKARLTIARKKRKEIACALRDEARLSTAQIAEVLHSKDGLELPAAEVACMLHNEDGLGLPVAEVVRALYSEEGIDLRAWETAYALYCKEGLDLSAAEVARAMLDFGMRAEEIADALREAFLTNTLYSHQRLAAAKPEVAYVLSNKNTDIDLFALRFVAKALARNGLPAAEIADVLCGKGRINLTTAEIRILGQ